MRSCKPTALLVVLVLSLAGCHRRPTAPDGNKLTESGNEIPKPVDDSVISKEDEDPPKPEVK